MVVVEEKSWNSPKLLILNAKLFLNSVAIDGKTDNIILDCHSTNNPPTGATVGTMHFATTRGADDVPFSERVPPAGLASTLGMFSPESAGLQIKILVNDIEAFREGPPNSCFFFKKKKSYSWV